MFKPEDKVTLPEGDEGIVKDYETRTQVVVESEGEVKIYIESDLKRPPRVTYKYGVPLPEVPTDLFRMRLNLKDRMESLPLDPNGHWVKGDLAERFFVYTLQGLHIPLEEVKPLYEAVKSGKPLDRWVEMETSRAICPRCTVKRVYTNGATLRIGDEPCPHADGLVATMTLPVPSGKIVFHDDLRFLNPARFDRDINHMYYWKVQFDDYAAQNFVYIQMSNTNPSILRSTLDPNTLIVEDCEIDDSGDDWVEVLPDNTERLGYVSTGLWAVNALDYDDFLYRVERLSEHYESFDDSTDPDDYLVVQVEPGMYEVLFFVDNGLEVDSHREAHRYAEFVRVGDVEEDQDEVHPIDRWLQWEPTPGQIAVAQHRYLVEKYRSARNDPSPDEDWESFCAQWNRNLFRGCIPSRDWTPMGFINEMNPGQEAADEDREWARPRQWVTFDPRMTVLPHAVGEPDPTYGRLRLNTTWANAALKYLEQAVSWGCSNSELKGEAYIEECRKGVREAVDLYRQILDEYPGADYDLQDFTAWIDDEEAVEAWISNYTVEVVVK